MSAWCYVLRKTRGWMIDYVQEDDDYRTLGIGERYQINAGRAHQTSNRGTRDCRFLIVQGVGRYDFLRSPL
jgi:hypothetical protein